MYNTVHVCNTHTHTTNIIYKSFKDSYGVLLVTKTIPMYTEKQGNTMNLNAVKQARVTQKAMSLFSQS